MSRNNYRNRKTSATSIEEVTIESLGAKGDGIATLSSGKPLYVPYAAPGDRARVSVGSKRGDGHAGTIKELLAGGPDRVAAECPHFGICGGCALQHLSDEAAAALKTTNLETALRRRDIKDRQLNPIVTIPPGQRRRAEFAIGTGGRVSLGLHQARSKGIVDIETCPVLVPALVDLLAPMRALLAKAAPATRARDIRMTETETGLDLVFLSEAKDSPDISFRQGLANFAQTYDIARISWSDRNGAEPLILRRQPEIRFGSAKIALPMKYFLQPSRSGERAISDIVCAAIGDVRHTADLFAGCGSLSFPLAENTNVTAFELEDEMVGAMRRAAAGLSFNAEQRDLARSPLTERELKAFDAVVFDPPRAGAREQAEYIALSGVPIVVAVSCNPNTFARDLRILIDGGYAIESITPIDQFSWSAELEAVAILHKA